MAKITLNAATLNRVKPNVVALNKRAEPRPVNLMITLSEKTATAMVLYTEEQGARYFKLNDEQLDKVKKFITTIETEAIEL